MNYSYLNENDNECQNEMLVRLQEYLDVSHPYGELVAMVAERLHQLEKRKLHVL